MDRTQVDTTNLRDRFGNGHHNGQECWKIVVCCKYGPAKRWTYAAGLCEGRFFTIHFLRKNMPYHFGALIPTRSSGPVNNVMNLVLFAWVISGSRCSLAGMGSPVARLGHVDQMNVYLHVRDDRLIFSWVHCKWQDLPFRHIVGKSGAAHAVPLTFNAFLLRNNLVWSVCSTHQHPTTQTWIRCIAVWAIPLLASAPSHVLYSSNDCARAAKPLTWRCPSSLHAYTISYSTSCCWRWWCTCYFGLPSVLMLPTALMLGVPLCASAAMFLELISSWRPFRTHGVLLLSE